MGGWEAEKGSQFYVPQFPSHERGGATDPYMISTGIFCGGQTNSDA